MVLIECRWEGLQIVDKLKRGEILVKVGRERDRKWRLHGQHLWLPMVHEEDLSLQNMVNLTLHTIVRSTSACSRITVLISRYQKKFKAQLPAINNWTGMKKGL